MKELERERLEHSYHIEAMKRVTIDERDEIMSALCELHLEKKKGQPFHSYGELERALLQKE